MFPNPGSVLKRQLLVRRKGVFFTVDASSLGSWWTAILTNATFPELRIVKGFYKLFRLGEQREGESVRQVAGLTSLQGV